MEYKIVVDRDGSWNGSVVNAGTHKCEEFVTVMNSMGHVDSVKTKKDDRVPVKNDLFVQGGK